MSVKIQFVPHRVHNVLPLGRHSVVYYEDHMDRQRIVWAKFRVLFLNLVVSMVTIGLQRANNTFILGLNLRRLNL